MGEVRRIFKPGDDNYTWDVSEEMGEGATILGAPDFVVTPIGLPDIAAGTRINVRRITFAIRLCPKHGEETQLRVFLLDHENLMVLECKECNQYMWVKV